MIPVLSTESESTKDKVVAILASEQEMSTKKINTILRKRYALHITYQAVHKTLKLMLKQGILEFDGGVYSISPEWVKKVEIFLSKINKNHAGEFLVSQDQETQLISVNSLKECDAYFHKFREESVNSMNYLPVERRQIYFYLPHSYASLGWPKKEQDYMELLNKFNTKIIYFCQGKTIVDKWVKQFYEQIPNCPMNMYLDVAFESTSEKWIYPNMAIDIYYHPQYLDVFNTLYNETKDINHIKLSTFLRDVYNVKKPIQLIVNKNKQFVESLQEISIAKQKKIIAANSRKFSPQSEIESNLTTSSEINILDNLSVNVLKVNKARNLELNKKCKELKSKGVNVYAFGFGQSPFPVPINVVDELRKHASEKNYMPVSGLPLLREAVAEFHQKRDNLPINKNSVLIGPGSKQLLITLQWVLKGKTIIPTPAWLTYAPQVEMIGKKVNYIHTTYENYWKVTPSDIENFFKKNDPEDASYIIILNYPSACGTTYTKRELKALGDVFRKYKIIVLADEIYGELTYDNSHVSISNFYPGGTIISSGISKWCGAGGWRLGIFIFPKELSWIKDAMETVASITYTSVSAPIQFAAVQAYSLDQKMENYRKHQRRIFKLLGDTCAKILKDADVKVHSPTAAFYLMPDFTNYREKLAKKNIFDSITLCDSLFKEKKVALLNGVDLGRDPKDLVTRLAFVDFDGENALKQSMKYSLDESLPENFIKDYLGHVVEGVQKIVDWLPK